MIFMFIRLCRIGLFTSNHARASWEIIQNYTVRSAYSYLASKVLKNPFPQDLDITGTLLVQFKNYFQTRSASIEPFLPSLPPAQRFAYTQLFLCGLHLKWPNTWVFFSHRLLSPAPPPIFEGQRLFLLLGKQEVDEECPQDQEHLEQHNACKRRTELWWAQSAQRDTHSLRRLFPF